MFTFGTSWWGVVRVCARRGMLAVALGVKLAWLGERSRGGEGGSWGCICIPAAFELATYLVGVGVRRSRRGGSGLPRVPVFTFGGVLVSRSNSAVDAAGSSSLFSCSPSVPASTFRVRPHPSTRGGAKVEVGSVIRVRVRWGCPGCRFGCFRVRGGFGGRSRSRSGLLAVDMAERQAVGADGGGGCVCAVFAMFEVLGDMAVTTC